MIANGIEIISDLSVAAAKILLVLGMVFVILKVIDKRLDNQSYKAFYAKMKLPLYHTHVNATKLATVLALVHGFTASVGQPGVLITGWVLGIIMLLLLALGVILSIKNKAKPMDGEKDLEWKTIRIIKWILTVIGFLVLVVHVL